MPVKGIDFVVYDVSNLQQSVAFYRDTLGLTLELLLEEGDWAEFAIGLYTLALCGPKSKEWGVPNAATPRPESGYKGEAAVALAVDDVEATLAELRSQGVSIAVEKQNSGVCYFAVITDPDGNRLWLHQRY